MLPLADALAATVQGTEAAHLDAEGVRIASSQAPHAVIGDAIIHLAPGLGALLLAGLLQGMVLAIGAILHAQ